MKFRLTCLLICFFGMVSCQSSKTTSSKNVNSSKISKELGEEKPDQPITLVNLKYFLQQETYDFDSQAKRPTTKRPSSRLYRFVLDNYIKNAAVRHELTKYYLDYSYACLKRKLVDYKEIQGHSFVSLFVRNEFEKEKKIQKSPSLSYIRKHIQQKSTWLGHDTETLERIKRNKNLHIRNLSYSR